MLSQFSAPLSVYLCVTNKCNLTCIYCSAESGEAYPDELSTEEMYRLIDGLAEAKVFSATITGGEPLLRTDIFQIIERLQRHRIVVSMISNGTIINDRIAQQLVGHNINDIKISLDATSPDANDSCRGEAAFSRAYRGIHTLLAHNIRPAILVTTSNVNFRLAHTIVQDLKEINVKSVSFNMISAVGRGTCSYPVLTLSPEEIVEFADSMRELKSSYDDFVKEDFLHWYEVPARLRAFLKKESEGVAVLKKNMLPCGAAKTSCSITADGWVIPCNKFTGYRCGNVRQDGFLNIWRNQKMEAVRSLAKKPTHESSGCSACNYNAVCGGGCRAEAYLHFGDLEAPDPGCSVLPDSAVHNRKPLPHLIQISNAAPAA